MKRTFFTALAAMMLCIPTFAETSETVSEEKETKKEKKEVKYNEKGEIIKTGLNFGPLPVVAFDADRGFQYGALLNIYNFGDGSTYPNPKSWWYIEASAYTKGTWNLFLNYDNREIFDNARLSICTNYSNETAMDFYGFNGYQSIYIPDQEPFYRYTRQSFRSKADLTGEIANNFYWEAGYTFYWMKDKAFTPDNVPADGSLYQLYKDWGIIEDSSKGNIVSALKAGLMYDTRNVQNNPTKGIWAEAHAIVAPKWLGSSMDSYKISATWRQYVPIVSDKLVFAYRLAYQGFLGKNIPWYLLPFYSNMGYTRDYEAIGGYRTVRGLMLNRVQGLHTGFYNLEFRYRFIDFQMLNQNIAFAVSAFTDGAQVFKGYDITNKTGAHQELYKRYVDTSHKDRLHATAGAGLRFIMNQNFIVAFEYARSFNKQDGNGSFYINTGFLF